MVKFCLSFFLVCFVILNFLQTLYAQTFYDAAYLKKSNFSAKTNFELPDSNARKQKDYKAFLENTGSLESQFYYRTSDLFEQTGNEDTFAVSLTPSFSAFYEKAKLRLRFSAKFTLLMPLSRMGRLNRQMTPPFLWQHVAFDFQHKEKPFFFIAGLLPPVVYHYPFRMKVHPVMYGGGSLPGDYFHLPEESSSSEGGFKSIEVNEFGRYKALFTGYRDLPIMYSGLIGLYDTGLRFGLTPGRFYFLLSIANGEEGLDSNSAKTAGLDFGYRGPVIRTGSSVQIGNRGSVPVKQTRHLYKYYFFYNVSSISSVQRLSDHSYDISQAFLLNRYSHKKKSKDTTLSYKFSAGVETFFMIHGLRRTNIFFRDYEILKEKFDYGSLFFDPFTLEHPSVYGKDPFIKGKGFEGYGAVGGYLFLKWHRIINKRLSLLVHYSFYDPSVRYDDKAFYQTKHRIHASVTVHMFRWLEFTVSDTYTYDPVYMTYHQYYERESRTHHYQLDNDLFAGLMIKIPFDQDGFKDYK